MDINSDNNDKIHEVLGFITEAFDGCDGVQESDCYMLPCYEKCNLLNKIKEILS